MACNKSDSRTLLGQASKTLTHGFSLRTPSWPGEQAQSCWRVRKCREQRPAMAMADIFSQPNSIWPTSWLLMCEWVHPRSAQLWPFQQNHTANPRSMSKKKKIMFIVTGHCSLVQFSSVAQSCPTLCDPTDCSMPGLPVHHQLPELAQSHVGWLADAIRPSHPLSSPSPPALNLSQHQGLFILLVAISLPRWLRGEESTCQCRRPKFDPRVGEIPLEKEMANSSFLAWEIPWIEESSGRYSPWGHKESDTTEAT